MFGSGDDMGAFNRFFPKEKLIRKTIEMDHKLYENLRKISEINMMHP